MPPDGSAGLAYAVPTPGGGWVSSDTGEPVSSDVPVNPEVTPETDQTVQQPVIDVGSKPGTQERTVTLGKETKPGAEAGSDKVKEPPTEPHPSGMVQGEDGRWTMGPETPPPGEAPKPADTAENHPSGLVKGPDGRWMTPEAAANARSAAPAAPATPDAQPVQPAPAATPGSAVAAPVPASVAGQELKAPPALQPVQDVLDWVGGLGTSLRHGITMGFDESLGAVPDALRISVTEGVPFLEAYHRVQAAMKGGRQVFETQNPKTATAAEIAGGIVPAVVTSPAYLGAKAGVQWATSKLGAKAGETVLNRVLTSGANTAINAGQGAVAGFGNTEGTVGDKLAGALEGSKYGVLASPLGAAATTLVRAVAPVIPGRIGASTVDRVAGKELISHAPGGQPPNFEKAPIENFPLGVGGASNDPELAALERQARELNDRKALEQKTAQNKALREAATEPHGGTPGQYGPHPVGSTRLASGEMQPSEASGRVVEGMQDAHEVLKQEETRLWNKPTMLGNQPDLPALKQRVDKEIGGMSQLTRREIAQSKELQDGLEHLATLEPGSSLRDVNDARSKILDVSRDPNQTASVRRAAGELGKTMVDAIEANPALRNDPAAWRDYVQARNFTAKKWDVLGYSQFQSMLLNNKFGNAGVDPRTAAGKVFGFGKNSGEVVPGGFNAIGGMLDDVRKQWAALNAAGQGAGFSPAAALAAKVKLTQGARDYIVSSMLDSAGSTVRDLSGKQGIILNSVSDFIDTNEGWIKRSGMFTQDQLDLLRNIKEAAKMGARPDNLTGGKGSASYARLMRDPRFIDLLTTPAAKLGAGAMGAIVGAWLGHMGEAGIGALIGMEGMHVGPALLGRLFGANNEQLRAKLSEAMFDPKLAKFLMQRANGRNAQYAPPEVKAFYKSWFSQQAGGEEQRLETMPPPAPPTTPVAPPHQPGPAVAAGH